MGGKSRALLADCCRQRYPAELHRLTLTAERDSALGGVDVETSGRAFSHAGRFFCRLRCCLDCRAEACDAEPDRTEPARGEIHIVFVGLSRMDLALQHPPGYPSAGDGLAIHALNDLRCRPRRLVSFLNGFPTCDATQRPLPLRQRPAVQTLLWQDPGRD